MLDSLSVERRAALSTTQAGTSASLCTEMTSWLKEKKRTWSGSGACLKPKYIVKVRGIMGPEEKDKKCIEILGRAVEWRNEELWWEADPRHVERILEDMEMVECNGSSVPGVKLQEADGDDDELGGLDLTKYRSVVARANFVAQDRPDIRYSVKELCRDMSRPVQRSFRRLKKLVRYLKAHPRVVQKIKLGHQGGEQDCVAVMVDSDWAGCSLTRKSTNGGCLMWRGVCLKAWSTTQGAVALSSGEAEYYAAVKGASEGLGFQSACRDLGIHFQQPDRVCVLTDSSACKGICQRTGLGKVRHLEVAYLWLQDLTRKGRITLKRIPGQLNPADLMTKYLSGGKTISDMEKLGFTAQEGRTSIVDGL